MRALIKIEYTVAVPFYICTWGIFVSAQLAFLLLSFAMIQNFIKHGFVAANFLATIGLVSIWFFTTFILLKLIKWAKKEADSKFYSKQPDIKKID